MTYSILTYPSSVILRDVDRTFIPNDPDNLDYQNYVAWLGAGNEPKFRTSIIEIITMEARLDDLETRVADVEAKGRRS